MRRECDQPDSRYRHRFFVHICTCPWVSDQGAVLCPRCDSECAREEADVGVGIVYGPWGCSICGWSESPEYDLSGGRDPIDEKGGLLNQFGVYYPSENVVARAYRFAKVADAS